MSKSPTPKPSATETGSPSFEGALRRLEEIVSQLERGEAPLEHALTLYEEGVKLARLCSDQLQAAERRVEILEDKNGRMQARPFLDSSRRAELGLEPEAAKDEDEEEDEETDDEDEVDEEVESYEENDVAEATDEAYAETDGGEDGQGARVRRGAKPQRPKDTLF